MISFYCRKCKLDQNLREEKKDNSFAAWFEARCKECGSRLFRYISEPSKDPYFVESRKLREERHRYHNDLVQPGEAGFKTLYPQEWAKLEKARESWFLEQEKKKRERDAFYNEHKLYNKGLAKKVIEIEEKIGNARN